MTGRSLFHLQRAVLDGETLFQRPHDVVHASIAGIVRYDESVNKSDFP